MLISLDYKFIFVANLKTGSTAIESALREYSEIALVESQFEKHAPLSEIERRFSWVFDLITRQAFFIFGVIRDPVDYVISIYNSHADDKFLDNPSLYTRGLSFFDFRNKWAEANFEQLLPQYHRFLRRDGSFGLDYLMAYERLPESFRSVTERLGISAKLEHLNVSERLLGRRDLTAGDLEWIDAHFRQDRRLLSNWCDRTLTEADRRSAGAELIPMSAQPHRLEPSNPYQLSGGWEELVHALYRVLLLREPDLPGLRGGLELLRNGSDFENLMRGCLKSEEFARSYQRFTKAYIQSEFLDSTGQSNSPSSEKGRRPPAGGASVAAVVLAYNSKEILSVTLPRLTECFDEIVIVDMGSNDGSRGLYSEVLGDDDTVVLYDRRNLFQFGFSHARNYGARFVKSDWIFAIDTDEFLSATEFRSAMHLMQENGQACFTVTRRNYDSRQEFKISDVAALTSGCPFKEEPQRRLYPNNPQFRFEGIIHEELFYNGKIASNTAIKMPLVIHHLSRYAEQDQEQKQQLYAFLLLRAAVHPPLRFGTNNWWFKEYVPNNLEALLQRANRFASKWGFSSFVPAQLTGLEAAVNQVA